MFYFTLLVLSCPVPFSSLVVFSLFSRLDSSHSYVPYVNLPMTSPPTISKHPAPSDNHSASSNSPSNMSSQKIPSQQQGNQEQPQRSRNARAQARHRAKRKAYIEQVRSLSLSLPLPLFPPLHRLPSLSIPRVLGNTTRPSALSLLPYSTPPFYTYTACYMRAYSSPPSRFPSPVLYSSWLSLSSPGHPTVV